MSWLLGLLGIGSGPVGWVAIAASWAMKGWKWALENWKLVLAVLAVAFIFFAGYSWGAKRNEASWVKKEAARVEHEREVAALRKRAIDRVDGAVQQIENKATESRAKREVVYRDIEKEVTKYVERHSQPTAPGTCPTDTDIGDDGVRLIERARRARSGAGEGR